MLWPCLYVHKKIYFSFPPDFPEYAWELLSRSPLSVFVPIPPPCPFQSLLHAIGMVVHLQESLIFKISSCFPHPYLWWPATPFTDWSIRPRDLILPQHHHYLQGLLSRSCRLGHFTWTTELRHVCCLSVWTSRDIPMFTHLSLPDLVQISASWQGLRWLPCNHCGKPPVTLLTHLTRFSCLCVYHIWCMMSLNCVFVSCYFPLLFYVRWISEFAVPNTTVPDSEKDRNSSENSVSSSILFLPHLSLRWPVH